MKQRIKWGLLGTIFCGMLLLCAFTQRSQTAEEKVGQALDKLQRAESMETTLTMDMEMKLLWMKMSAQATMDMVTIKDPMKIRAEMTLDLGWLGSSELQVYAYETKDAYQLLLYEGKKWSGEAVASEKLKRYDGKKMMETYLEQIDELCKVGEDKLDGSVADRYTGVIHSEGLEKVLLDTGSVEMLLSVLEQDMLKPVGEYLRKNEELIPQLMNRAEDMTVTLWIDQKTGYPMQCSMDITRMVCAAMEEFQKADSGGSGNAKKGLIQKATANLWSNIEITQVQVMIQCGDFNQVEDFVIPKEALESIK